MNSTPTATFDDVSLSFFALPDTTSHFKTFSRDRLRLKSLFIQDRRYWNAYSPDLTPDAHLPLRSCVFHNRLIYTFVSFTWQRWALNVTKIFSVKNPLRVDLRFQ